MIKTSKFLVFSVNYLTLFGGLIQTISTREEANIPNLLKMPKNIKNPYKDCFLYCCIKIFLVGGGKYLELNIMPILSFYQTLKYPHNLYKPNSWKNKFRPKKNVGFTHFLKFQQKNKFRFILFCYTF